MDGRAWCDREGRAATSLDEKARAQGDAPLALAPARAKARVSLERFDIRVAANDRVVEVGQGHVLAAARQCLGHVATSLPEMAPAGDLCALGHEIYRIVRIAPSTSKRRCRTLLGRAKAAWRAGGGY